MYLLKKADYNAKIYEIPSISGWATAAPLSAVGNKIPDLNNEDKKTDYDTKILNIECKYFITTDYNKFTSQTIGAKIKQKRLRIGW